MTWRLLNDPAQGQQREENNQHSTLGGKSVVSTTAYLRARMSRMSMADIITMMRAVRAIWRIGRSATWPGRLIIRVIWLWVFMRRPGTLGHGIFVMRWPGVLRSGWYAVRWPGAFRLCIVRRPHTLRLCIIVMRGLWTLGRRSKSVPRQSGRRMWWVCGLQHPIRTFRWHLRIAVCHTRICFCMRVCNRIRVWVLIAMAGRLKGWLNGTMR